MQHADLPAVLADITRWTQHDQRRATPTPNGLKVVLTALVNELGATGLAALDEGLPSTVLLDACPDKVSSDEVDDVLGAARTVVDYAADTGHISATLGESLLQEIDSVADEFTESVFAGDLVAALDDDLDDDDDDEEEEPVDFAEIFGTETLPPLRLPAEPDLANAARASTRLSRVRDLAHWVGHGRAVTADGELTPEESATAVQELDISVPGPDPDGGARAAELTQLWELADALGFLEVRDADAVAGPAVEEWPDGDDETVLALWAQALNEVGAWSLPLDTDHYDESVLDFSAAGGTLLTLFSVRDEGSTLARLSDMVRETADGPDTSAGEAWDAWVAAHGDPARVLYGRLAELGAVDIDEEEVVRLTPLALSALWAEITVDIDIPLLPEPEDMAAAALLSLGTTHSDEVLTAEWQAWRESRSADAAARELADAAVEGGPDERVIANSLLHELGAEANDVWRTLLDIPALRPYAKQALSDLHDGAPEFELDDEDTAWLLLDLCCDLDEDEADDELGDILADAVGSGEESVFEAMARLEHPHTHGVLTLIGRHHPDKALAKAARKASFTVSPS